MELCWPRSGSESAGRGCRDRDGDEPARDLGACVRARSRGQRDGVRDARSREPAAVRGRGRERKTACVSRHDVPGRAAGLGDGAGDAGGGAMIPEGEMTLPPGLLRKLMSLPDDRVVGFFRVLGLLSQSQRIEIFEQMAAVKSQDEADFFIRRMLTPRGPVPKCPTR